MVIKSIDLILRRSKNRHLLWFIYDRNLSSLFHKWLILIKQSIERQETFSQQLINILWSPSFYFLWISIFGFVSYRDKKKTMEEKRGDLFSSRSWQIIEALCEWFMLKREKQKSNQINWWSTVRKEECDHWTGKSFLFHRIWNEERNKTDGRENPIDRSIFSFKISIV